jgi:decaprenylphospho-beta-D-ribofuranose 2-oxidase
VTERLLTGWGRTAPSRARWRAPATAGDVGALLQSSGPRGAIARGLGRSYGDAAQNAGGDVLAMTALRGIRALDAAAGTLTAEAGASFHALLAALVPRGWFLPVVPGTRQITLGGAIAGDVHGKNHHRDGAFGRHVRSMTLLAGSGERLTLSPDATPEAFAATAGGMGLTGVLLEATVALTPIETSWMTVDLERAGDLDEAMASMTAGDERHRYSVAWIDGLARGRRLGRCVLMRGDHATADELPAQHRSAPLARPRRPQPAAPRLPSGLLRRPAVAAFNELYFRRAPRRERRLVPLDRFFFPLDGVRDWNRAYGARGFLQYQVVVPFGREDLIRTVIERLHEARAPAFLGVLKRFGAQAGPLSFPMPGWTLAVDVPVRPGPLAPVLDGLDELVAGAGGRVYLAKDSRLRPDAVAAMYPRLAGWREARARLDPERVMRSDLARRVGLVA